MTILTPKASPRSRLLVGFIAVFAVLTAALIGASQFTGDTARAQQNLTLHQPGSVHPGAAATGTCPTPPAGQEDWFGWHFVAPSNENFTSLSVAFAGAGTFSASPFPGTTFVSHPDASHAYIWTPTADTLVSGSATIAGEANQDFFNLSSTCAPAQAPEETGQITIVKQGLLAGATANFSHDITAGGSFTATMDDTTEVFTDVPAGDYSVTEAPLEGYTLVSVGCSLDLGRSAVQESVEGNTLGIVLEAGMSLTCTFVNAPAQTSQHVVTVTKYVDDALATEGDFSLTSTRTAANLNGGVETSGNFNLNPGNSWQAVTSAMDAGADYSVVENSIDGDCDDEGDVYRLAGYGIGATLEAAAAATPAGTAAITDLQADMHIVVFNETCDTPGTSSVTIVKEWQDAEGNPIDAPATDFTSDIPADGADAFTLDGEEDSITFDGLDAATYVVTETPPAGWHLESRGCELTPEEGLTPQALPSNSLTIVLGEDMDLTCTFVNVPDSQTVTVQKFINGSAAAETSDTFEVTSSAGDATLETANSFTAELQASMASNFTLSETGIDGTCDEGDTYRLAGFGIGATAEEAAAASLVDTVDVTLEGAIYVIVHNQLCEGLGSITIEKDFNPDSASEVDFTAEGFGTADFSITEAEGHTFANLSAGSYTFTEVDTPQWMVSGINCSGDSNITVDLGAGAVTVDLVAGADVTCTFTNVPDTDAPEGSITLTKVWEDEAGDPATPVDATFATSPNLNVPGDELVLTGSGASETFSNLAADSFSFDEAALEGWTVTDITCSGSVPENFAINLGQGSVTINLQEDESVTCTVTNTFTGVVAGTGSLEIKKLWSGGDPVATTFTTSDNLGGGTFELSDTTESELFDGLGEGNYVITETIPDGWDVTSIVCTGHTNTLWDTDFPTGVLSVDLVDDDDLVCTFTNTLEGTTPPPSGDGTLTITKVWVGGDPATTSFTTTGLGGATFELTGPSDSEVFEDLAEGNYVVTETIPDGWDVTSIVCTGHTNTVWDTDFPTGVLSVDLVDDEDLTCTFTNTAETTTPPGDGSLTITKVWSGGTGTANFTATGSGLSNFSLNGATTIMDFTGLANGSYSVVEDALAGWTLTVSCSGNTASTVDTTTNPRGVSLTLANGEDIDCTFTNTAVNSSIQNPVTNNPGIVSPNIPGVVSPSNPETPGVVSPTTPNMPNVPNQPGPVENIPPASQPGIVSNEFPTSVGSFQQPPLPPETGNSPEGNANTSVALAAGLAAILGVAAATAYGLRRR